ncbi:MAG: hypothetical protein JRE10_04275 [Deltaproteobacteria bacterium]|nr:hypothetical protein [Deltaproteobacteria bacterium]
MAKLQANILFVCTGNICRSPFAHAFFVKLVNQKRLQGIAVESAGLLALPGNSATYMAQIRVQKTCGLVQSHSGDGEISPGYDSD